MPGINSSDAFEVIDVHHHVGRTVVRVPEPSQEPADSLLYLRANGIAAAILSPVGGASLRHGLRGVARRNDRLAALRDEHPGLYPLALADAELRLGPDVAAEELRRCIGGLRFAGACLVPMFSGYVIGPVLDPVMRVLSEARGLCLLHASPESASRTCELISRYPEVTFIVPHLPMYETKDAELLATLENAWFDISQNTGAPRAGRLEAVVSAIGCDRLLVGTDVPYFGTGTSLDVLRNSTLSGPEKASIGAGNARRLIDNFSSGFTADER